MTGTPYIGYIWLVAAGILVALELTLGSPSFVLLIFGIAAGAGAVTAFFGGGLILQLLAAVLVSIASYVLMRRMKYFDRLRPELALDVGASVALIEKTGAGEAKVMYRGANWIARTDDADIDWDAPLFIKEVRGTTLIVSSVKQ